MENYYQILGIQPGASDEAIRSRYRFLAKAYHPDRFGDESRAQAEEEMKRINQAYAVLGDPEKRLAYDLKMGLREAPAPPPPPPSPDPQPEPPPAGANPSEQIQETIQAVRSQWMHLVFGVHDQPAVMAQTDALLSMAVELVGLANPGSRIHQRSPQVARISEQVRLAVLANACLGAAYETDGPPRGIPPVQILLASMAPMMTLVQQQCAQGAQRNVLREADIRQYAGQISNMLQALCTHSQGYGRAIAQEHRQGSTKQAAGQQNAQARQEPRRTSKKESEPAAAPEPTFCQSCGRVGPVKHITLHQFLGFIIIGRHRRLEGDLCANCIEQHFWEMSGKTLLFGWWFPFYIIGSPFGLLLNLLRYLGAWGLRGSAPNLGRIALGWKLISLLVVAGIIGYGVYLNTPRVVTVYYVYSDPQPTAVANIAVTRTSTPVPTRSLPTVTPRKPSPTPQSCTHWSEVTKADKNRYLCVYGNVKKAYWGDNLFYMSFSDSKDAFRMIVLNGYYYEGVQGNCVQASGTIKLYDNMPYIEVSDQLWHCQ